MRRFTVASFLGSYLLIGALAQSWCGKHYMSTQKVVAPGGSFPVPSQSSDPLLAFRCAPAIRPYLAEDVSTPATIVVDAPIVHSKIANAQPIRVSDGDWLDVTVNLDGRALTTGSIPVNESAYEFEFSLKGITPRKEAYHLSCEAKSRATSQKFSATTTLSVLPNPKSGSVTKMDLRTGALLAKPATGLGGNYAPVFPIGFYTTFDGYLAKDFSLIDGLKKQGFSIIQLLPPFNNLAALNQALDRMQKLGLYVVFQLHDYMNSTSLTEQIDAIKNRPNLLLWQSSDEPDGKVDPLNATVTAYDLIYNLDGYHPVSLVLNCQDYHWSSYTAGADIVLQDVYMVGNNVSWSTVWNTRCTSDFGDCGCDNCASIAAGNTAAVPPDSHYYVTGKVPANSGIGSFFDVSARVASFKDRLQAMDWERAKAVWTVPQAFGGSGGDYWPRMPTGQEWVVQSIMGINQGALGVVSWNDPTTADIKNAASAFAQILPQITPFLFDSSSVRRSYVVEGASVGKWDGGEQKLVLATNANYVKQTVDWGALGLGGLGVQKVYASGTVNTVDGGFELGPVASAAFLLVA